MTIKTQTERPSVALSAEVLRDLLDHDLDTLEVARRHDLDPDAVRAAVHSDAFRRAADAMREADQARTAAVWPSIQARAIHRLARIANQPAETPTQTESARRALTALLKCKPPAGDPAPAATPHQTARPDPDEPPAPPASVTPRTNPVTSPAAADPNAALEQTLRLIAQLKALRDAAQGQPESHARSPTPAAQLRARAGAPTGPSP